MTQQQLIRLIAERTGLTIKDTRRFLLELRAVGTEVLASGEKFTLGGLAVFKPIDQPARRGRNPQTGEAVHIRARRAVRIRPCQALRDAVEQAG